MNITWNTSSGETGSFEEASMLTLRGSKMTICNDSNTTRVEFDSISVTYTDSHNPARFNVVRNDGFVLDVSDFPKRKSFTYEKDIVQFDNLGIDCFSIHVEDRSWLPKKY